MNDRIPPKTFNAVAQAGHLQAGCLSVFVPAAFTQRLLWCGIGAALLVTFAAGKEFWWDHRYETKEVRGSDLEDFSFYAGGAVLSLLIYWGFR
jgi:hypothetical protein